MRALAFKKTARALIVLAVAAAGLVLTGSGGHDAGRGQRPDLGVRCAGDAG
jgi:hypothetical protein